MSSSLFYFTKKIIKHSKLTILLWIILLILLGILAGGLSKPFNNNISFPALNSSKTYELLKENIPELHGTTAQIIIIDNSGNIKKTQTLKDFKNYKNKLEKLPDVSFVSSNFDYSQNNKAAMLTIMYKKPGYDIKKSTKNALIDSVNNFKKQIPKNITVSVGGDMFSIDIPGIEPTEMIGIGIALIILFLTFFSFSASLTSIVNSLIAVGVSMISILILTHFTDVMSVIPLLALMLGIAVGIDYALFILSRHREQLKSNMKMDISISSSVATAGSAVIFAGTTVIVALIGLVLSNIPFMILMCLWAAFGIFLSVLASLTFLPAILKIIGLHVLSPKDIKIYKQNQSDNNLISSLVGDGEYVPDNKFSTKIYKLWVNISTKIPPLTIIVIILFALLLSKPLTKLELALPDDGSFAKGTVQRNHFDLVSKYYGKGYSRPIILLGNINQSMDPVKMMNDIGKDVEKIQGVEKVVMSTPDKKGQLGIVELYANSEPSSKETANLIHKLRDKTKYFKDKYNYNYNLTGQNAMGVDIANKLSSIMLPFIIFVVGISFLLLMMLFRSILIPLFATIGFLLSIGSAFGAIALVYNNGHFVDLLKIPAKGPIISFGPIIIMAILFGLAMDYQVFLVSRIRESYTLTNNPKLSVKHGFLKSSKVIVSAALIMFSVFLMFIYSNNLYIKPIALGLSVGIAFDALLVRMSLMPAILYLFGNKIWWMPKKLEEFLPIFDVEGERLRLELKLENFPTSNILTNEKYAVYAKDLILQKSLYKPELEKSFDLSKKYSFSYKKGSVYTIKEQNHFILNRLLSAISGRYIKIQGNIKTLNYVLP